jgi:hypothetical protein
MRESELLSSRPAPVVIGALVFALGIARAPVWPRASCHVRNGPPVLSGHHGAAQVSEIPSGLRVQNSVDRCFVPDTLRAANSPKNACLG